MCMKFSSRPDGSTSNQSGRALISLGNRINVVVWLDSVSERDVSDGWVVVLVRARETRDDRMYR
jgi:hypothetical protein